ncbi:hypothetical protein TNCV_4967311 [Trichonephila clavipes]|nr:hypothetical protein TNCV_4967311 [Trichonephila clavipes]
MFSNGDQRSWLKIGVAQGKNTTECNRGLLEVCVEKVLPYIMVARSVKASRSGRNESADLQHANLLSIPYVQIDIL